jgi:two-component system LytT family response regulator
MLEQHEPEYLSRVASRKGGQVEFIDIGTVTHFYAEDKLTFAVTEAKVYALDLSISELEQKLLPKQWIRIHRSTLLNIDAVKELRSWFGGKLLVKLKDGKTELHVARERAAEVKTKLGLRR